MAKVSGQARPIPGSLVAHLNLCCEDNFPGQARTSLALFMQRQPYPAQHRAPRTWERRYLARGQLSPAQHRAPRTWERRCHVPAQQVPRMSLTLRDPLPQLVWPRQLKMLVLFSPRLPCICTRYCCALALLLYASSQRRATGTRVCSINLSLSKRQSSHGASDACLMSRSTSHHSVT